MQNAPQQFAEMQYRLRKMEEANAKAFEEMRQLRDQRVLDLQIIDKVLGVTKVARTDSGQRNSPMAKGPGHGPYVDIAQIPGRHIPFDFLVDIPINDGVTDSQQGTLYVTMEGPMVCTHRVAIFRSLHQFRVTGTSTAAFQSRSFGRFRPIDSAADVMDSQRAFEQPNIFQPSYLGAVWDGVRYVPIGNPMGVYNQAGQPAANSASTSQLNAPPPFPGNGRPLNMSPLSMSAFRTMEMDATILVEVQGSNFHRSSTQVPSTSWRRFHNDPAELATPDVFEPGESVVINVTPTHVNNPAAGNVAGLILGSADYTYSNAAGTGINNPAPSPTLAANVGQPTGGWPFLAGQYDGHEGINSQTIPGDTGGTADRVTRVANGILTIGFLGYRIVQPPQMVA